MRRNVDRNAEIKKLYASGLPVKQIAKRLKVSVRTIYRAASLMGLAPRLRLTRGISE